MRARNYAFTALVFAAVVAAPTALAQQTCDTYFTKSQALEPLLTKAYAAMSPKKLETLKALLPELESAPPMYGAEQTGTGLRRTVNAAMPDAAGSPAGFRRPLPRPRACSPPLKA